MNLPIPESFKRRPSILNLLHLMKLIRPFSATNEQELACIERHASGKKLAVEIGTALGVSAIRIARELDPDGRLYCIDLFEEDNPVAKIWERQLRRSGIRDRVVFIRGVSGQVAHQIPKQCDFMFVDGDHSYDGLKTDWEIVLNCLAIGGVACFHDTTIPREEPHRNFGSVQFFNEVIAHHPDFRLLETCYSLNAVKRLKQT